MEKVQDLSFLSAAYMALFKNAAAQLPSTVAVVLSMYDSHSSRSVVFTPLLSSHGQASTMI